MDFQYYRYELQAEMQAGNQTHSPGISPDFGVTFFSGRNKLNGKGSTLKFYKDAAIWERETKMLIETARLCTNHLMYQRFFFLEDAHVVNNIHFTAFDAGSTNLRDFALTIKDPQALATSLASIMSKDILPALIWLQKNDICHGNINTLAFELKESSKGYSLCGFECSGYLDDDIPSNHHGTYTAPEVQRTLARKKTPHLSFHADDFALGVMLADILSGFTFWNKICADDSYSLKDFHESLQELDNLPFKGLLAVNPGDRLSAKGFQKMLADVTTVNTAMEGLSPGSPAASRPAAKIVEAAE